MQRTLRRRGFWQVIGLAASLLAIAVAIPVWAAVANVQSLWSDEPALAGHLLGDFDGDGRTDLFRVSGSQWQFSSAGTGPWQNLPVADSTPVENLRLGDFNGDNVTDVFSVVATGGTNQWRWSRSGRDPWQNLASDPLPLTDLRFGDFDGDNRTDVFSLIPIGGTYQWRFSSGGTGSWQNLATDPTPLADLRFGDFNGDNRTDVFSLLPLGGTYQWRYSSGGLGSWQSLLIDPTPLANLRFGDFDRDGRSDVFSLIPIGGTNQWRYSSGGVGPWQNLATDPAFLTDLRFGDFNGDRWTDVFTLSGGQARYSPSGTGAWINLMQTPTWTPSPTTIAPWSPVTELRFGDFDGDNRTDVFAVVPTGGTNQWRFSSGGTGVWQNLASDPTPLSELRFSDPFGDARDNFKLNSFSDRRTDIFSVIPSGGTNQWRYSAGGTGAWQNLASDPTPLANLRFGDFNGDSVTDVFSVIPSGGTNQWRFSSGGTGAWQNLASDPTPLTELRFGDFDGDNRTDVFSVIPSGGTYQWRFSSGGTGAWQNLASDPTPLGDLRFGDFNGDGRTDVFSVVASGGTYQWRYSPGGTGAWINLANDPTPLANLRFGDFNGDGRTDVFSVGSDGRWRYSSGGESGWILLGPPATATPTATRTPWPGVSVTPQPPIQPGCANVLLNGDMEHDQAWHFGLSPIPGKYTGIQSRNGLRSIQLGNAPDSGQQPAVSYSSVRQLVTIPAHAATAQLRWWHFFRTEQGVDPAPNNQRSRQEVILLSANGKTLRILQRVRRNDNSWQPETVDLTEFIGQSVTVYFNVYSDGSPARTWMFLDDVVLDVCLRTGQPLPQPYAQPPSQFGPAYPMPYGPTDYPWMLMPYGDPGYSGPGYGGPSYSGPGYSGPGYSGPGYGGPSYSGPGYSGPGYDGPRYTTPSPSSSSDSIPRAAFAQPTFTPTSLPTVAPVDTPTPSATSVATETVEIEALGQPATMPTPVGTPTPVAMPTGAPEGSALALVTRVIDGGTIEVVLSEAGTAALSGPVRYMLVDDKGQATPGATAQGTLLVHYAGVTVAPAETEQGALAAEANRLLVEGAVVYLEIVELGSDGNNETVEAYVFLPDGDLVNAVMVAAGHAVIAPSASDGPYEALLRQAQQEAQAASVGMWDLDAENRLALLGVAQASATPSGADAPVLATALCVELVNNGSFEAAGAGWNLTAGDGQTPVFQSEITFGDSRQALLLGIVDQENAAGISAADQTVHLPEDAASIVLTFRYYPLMDGDPGSGDLQYVDIYNAMTGLFAGRALGDQQDDARWLAGTYDLTSLAGQPVRLVFAVNNDGVKGRTAMVIDNVSILACGGTGDAAPLLPSGATAPPADAHEPDGSEPSPVLQTVLESQETGAPVSGPQRWLSWLFTGAVMLGVLGMIGFGVLVIRNTFQPPSGS